ncbi:MAG: HNH endonuclease [Ilumatobacter sp.]|nr:MAG: HNH endonuclease [Ilumatobacter sp.]
MAAATDQSNETDAAAGDGAGGAATGRCRLAEVHAAVDMLVLVDLGSCTHDDLDTLRGATQRLRSFAAAADVRIARRSQQLWATPSGGDDDDDEDQDSGAGDEGAGDEGAGDEGGSGPGGAKAIGGTQDRRSDEDKARDRARARVGELMRSFEAALEAGQIDVAHVDALVAALKRLETDELVAAFLEHEASLLGHAKMERPDRFRRRCHDLVRRLLRDHGVREAERKRRAATLRQWWNHRNDMGHLHLELDEERYARLETAINAKVDELRSRPECAPMSFDQLRLAAFMELVTASSASGVRPAEVSVLIDIDTLRTGVFGDSSVSETESGLPLTPEAVRRHACDGGIIPVVMGGDGVPLDVGRKRRLATREQRLALRAMHATCAHPECSRPFSWCRVHHIIWWELFGDTDLDNLIPLCDRHHHQVHEGGWTLTMTPDRVTTWRTPSGHVWYVGDTRDTAPTTWEHPTEGQRDGRGHRNGHEADHLHPDANRDQDPDDSADSVTPRERRRARRPHSTGTTPNLFAHTAEPAGP